MEKRIIALVVTRPQRDYNLDIIRHIRDELKARGMKLLVFGNFTDLTARDRNDYGEKSIYRIIPYDILSGLIIQAGTFQDTDEAQRIVDEAKAHKVPVIDLDHEMKGIPGVAYDYEGAFAAMVRHVVVDHHCHKVYMIAGMRGNEYSENRVKMFRQVCTEFGIPEEHAKVWYGEFWDWPARQAALEMIESKDLPEAIVCANDVMALAAMAVLQEKGYGVPEDVMVTGMDGIMLAKYSNPRLSTITTDSVALCREAAELMDELSRGQRDQARRIRIPMKLDLHRSCSCPQKEKVDPGAKLREMDLRVNTVENNERTMVRMRHKLMDDERSVMFEKLALYVQGDSWLCYNPSFWDRRDTQMEEDFDYEKEEDPFDEILTQVSIMPSGEPAERIYYDSFAAYELLPQLQEILRSQDMILFAPLNFQKEVIGYFAFCDIGLEEYPFHFSQFCMSLSMIMKVIRDREQFAFLTQMLEQSNKVLYDLSIHDDLTGLINRRGLIQRVEEMCEREKGSDKILSYTYIDVDGFKEINDKWGHDEGDEVLRMVAQTLLNAVSPWPDMKCARLGGDEFVVFGAMKDREEAEQSIDRIYQAFAELNETSGKEYLVELSVGQSLAKGVSKAIAGELIRKADEEMYHVKKIRKALKKKGDHGD